MTILDLENKYLDIEKIKDEISILENELYSASDSRALEIQEELSILKKNLEDLI